MFYNIYVLDPSVEYATRQAGISIEIRKVMMTQIPTSITPDVNGKLLRVLLANRRDLMDDELAELSAKIRPVVRDEAGRYFYVDPVHPRDVAFNEDPIFMERADGPRGIVRLSTIYTLHCFGNPRHFQASVADVLSMIPLRLLHRVMAFETVGPRSEADFDRQTVANDAGYHVAVTHLYV